MYALFALVTIGAALGNLSQTGLNAMLFSIMDEFGITVDVAQWLTTGYMLMLGIAVPVATFLTRKLDDRGYSLLCLGLFAAGSFVDYIAFDFFSMLAGRLLQATAVGLLIPKMQTISMTKFPPGRQATAMGVAGIALGFAPNIGPTVGGALDYSFGWRSFFLLLFALSLVLFLLTFPLIKSEKDLGSSEAHLEAVSLVFSTFGFGGVLLGLSQASSYGFASWWAWGPIVVGIVFLALFVRRQRVVEQPLLDLRIFESKVFNAGLIASVFLFASFMGMTLVIPLYVIGVLGGTSLDAGLVVLPATFTALLANPLSGVLADKTSPRLASLLFGTLLVVGAIACVFVAEDTPLWLLSIWQTTRAMGVSGIIGPLLTYSLSGLKGPLVAHGSTGQVVLRQVAATFGTAIMVFCIAAAEPLVLLGMLSAAGPCQIAFAFSAAMSIACMAVVVTRVK